MSRNYKYLKDVQPHQGRLVVGVSQTIPDEAMTMRTILERHAKGLPIAGEKEAIYDEDETSRGINPRNLDLVDLQEIAEQNKSDVNRLSSIIDEAKSKAKQKKVEFIENPLNQD